MASLLILGALFLFYLLVQELVRRGNRRIAFIPFGLLPILLTDYWFSTNDFDLFLWIKIYSVLGCICWASWLRGKTLEHNRILQTSIAVLLFINILEATLVDLWSSGLAHGLNAAAGVVLMLSMPKGAKEVSVDRQRGYEDLNVNVSRAWIVGYTTWNWTFVYLNYPQWSGHHIAVLGAALLIGLIEPQRWVQARACILGVNLLLTATFYEETLSVLDTDHWYSLPLAIAAASFALVWVVGSYWVESIDRAQSLRFVHKHLSHVRNRWNRSRLSIDQYATSSREN